ncbi:TonB-dependent receptor [Salibacteraceae bacterium]|nr:TonB-dependent receptor [Salibacteraceae bacterium]
MKYFLMLLLSAVASPIFTQEICNLTLTGHVIDEHDGAVLSFSEIRLLNDQRATVADQDGTFKFDKLCSGTLDLVINHIGCEPDTLHIELFSDLEMEFLLEHHSEMLEILTVEAKRPHKDIAQRVEVDKEKLDLNRGVSLASLLDESQGIQSLNTGGNISKPVIHGMHSNRVVIMSDNTKLQGQQWGSEHAPEIDPLSVASLEVIQGASGLRYGPEAIGGVVIAKKSELGKIRKLNGKLKSSISSNGRQGMLSGELQGALTKKLPLFFRAQLSGTKAGDLKAPDYYLKNTGKEEFSGSGQLSWIKEKYGVDIQYSQIQTQLGILSYSHIGNLSDLEQVIESGVPQNISDSFSYSISAPNQSVIHEITSARFFWKPKLESKVEFNISRQYNLRQEFDVSTFSDPSIPDLQYEITTHQADLHYEHRTRGNYKLEFGIASETQANTYEGRFFIPNFRNYQGGVYTIHHLNIGSWEFEGGARYDYKWQQAFMYQDDDLYSPVRTFDGLSWNIGVSKEIKKITLMMSFGRAWRAPSINELYSSGLHHGAAAIEFGDESIGSEVVHSGSVSLSTNKLSIFNIPTEVNASIFAYLFDSYIYLRPAQPPTLTIRGAFPTFYYSSVDAWFRGIDASIKLYPTSKLNIFLGVESIRANEINNGEYIINIPADRADASVEYSLWERKWSHKISFHSSFTRQQTRFPIGVDYTDPPVGYVLLGGRLSGALPIASNQLQYSFGVENASNQSYRSYLNRLRYYAVEPGINFILTLQFKF